MKALALVAAAGAAFLLAACSTNDGSKSPAELAAYWESQNIPPTNYKDGIVAFMRTYLNDPNNIRSAAVSPPVRKTVGPGERYVSCVRYDAKKSGGDYAGIKQGMAVFVSGRFDSFIEAKEENRDICKDAAYAPFPELSHLAR